MASGLYDSGRNGFARGDILWKASGGSTIKAVLIKVTAGYTVNLATHDNLDDISAGNRVATATLTLSDPSAGICDASDVTYTAVTGAAVEAIVLYKDTGVESTSTLIAYIDGFSSVTPNGGDITITWDNGSNKIFKL